MRDVQPHQMVVNRILKCTCQICLSNTLLDTIMEVENNTWKDRFPLQVEGCPLPGGRGSSRERMLVESEMIC